MKKNILITGATDGIGLETAKTLAAAGHNLLLHGRNPDKLARARHEVGATITLLADLSDLQAVANLAQTLIDHHLPIHVLINNAGVYRLPNPTTPANLDARFVVNTLAPCLLTQKLLPHLRPTDRVINLSSAAQTPVDLRALAGEVKLSDSEAYAQSKLALTMWSCQLGRTLQTAGPVLLAINPKSFLGSKMVTEAYGVAGADLSLGADILVQAALSDTFADATGTYFDNDNEQFADPHPDALNPDKCQQLGNTIETIITQNT